MLAAPGCAGSFEPETEARASQPIVGGVEDPGDPAVVFIRWPGYSCSGTLISSKIVLTAGHCGATGETPSSVYFGQVGGAVGGTTIAATQMIRHPEYANHLNDTSVPASERIVKNDIAIVVLASRASVEPVPPNFTTLTTANIVGKSVKFVGFGKTDGTPNASSGTKMMREQEINVLTDQLLEYDVATCQGDSGGPGLFTIGGVQTVVSITSFGVSGCRMENAAQRVDIHKVWLQGLMADHDPPSCERDFRCSTGCAGGDPDCPCAADGVCIALCKNPESDPDCPRGCGAGDTCVRGPQCPNPDPDCGDPCGAEGHCLTACPTRDPDCAPAKPQGTACGTSFECGDGARCVNTGAVGMPATCERTCDVAAADSCGAASLCQPLAGSFPAIAVCVADPAAAGCSVHPAAPSGVPVAAGGMVALFALVWWSRQRRRTTRTH